MHLPRRLSPGFSATDLLDFEDRFLNRRINNKDERPFLEMEAVVESVVKQLEKIQRHLCEIFNDYFVQVEQGPVSFQSMRFASEHTQRIASGR